MLSSIVRRGVAIPLFALLAACAAPGPTIRADYDRGTDFSAYKSYSYASPLGTDKAGYSTLTTQHFKNAIDTELQARGYARVDTGGDLLVNFNANAVEKADVRSSGGASVGMGYYGYRGGLYGRVPATGSDVRTVRYQVGTANIDIVDNARKTLLWEGVAEGKLTKEIMANPQPAIASVVQQLFQQFPGPVTPAP
jgi:hypothetical protein